MPGAHRLVYLPYLNGEQPPHFNLNCRGTFVGLAAIHTKENMTRAALGVAILAMVGTGAYLSTAEFKKQIIPVIENLGHEVEDFGNEDTIYANVAVRVGETVASKKFDREIITGIEPAKCLVKEYLGLNFDPNSRSAAKVNRIVEYEREHSTAG